MGRVHIKFNSMVAFAVIFFSYFLGFFLVDVALAPPMKP